MKNTFITLLASAMVMLFAASGCKSANVTVDRQNYNLDGNWYVTKIDNTVLDEVNPDLEWPHIEFNTSDNRISGNVGCNTMMGNFSYNNKGLMTFDNLGTTMMMCPSMDIEQKIIAAMPQVSGYSINNVTGQLILTNSKGETVMVLNRSNPIALLQMKQNY